MTQAPKKHSGSDGRDHGAKTLLLTEKPSVAKDFARALEVGGKRNGFFENDRYIITWAVGHLVTLCEPEDYDPGLKAWRLDSLPIIPREFRYKPIPDSEPQLRRIAGLTSRKDIGKILIATDAGREGEVIARTVLLSCGVPASLFLEPEKILRFWTSQALTPRVIRDGMRELKPAAAYDRLWRAGRCRQLSDWLVGMNLSRAATIRMKDLFTVGRVQTAVLALIVDRHRERLNFKPEPYWVLRARFSGAKGEWEGTWFRGETTRLSGESEARSVLETVSGKDGAVVSVSCERGRLSPPPLYSLTDLQRDANAKFGFTAKSTLDTAQALYEKRKCLSYPRTDARVLGSKNIDLVRSLLGRLGSEYPNYFAGIDPARVRETNRNVFNDAKLTDHHAIIPLAPLPGKVREEERKIYRLVLKRFAAAFHPDFEYDQTEVITGVCGENFRSKGRKTLKSGWRAVYDNEREDPREAPSERQSGGEETELLPLARGDAAHVENASLEKKETLPPPKYTDALLLKDMTHPGRYVTEAELKKIYRGEVGLGTQSTRAQIIETLLSRGYVFRRQKEIAAADKGCLLIDTLRKFKAAGALTSPEETARWESQLARIAGGEGSDTEFLEKISIFVQDMVEELKMEETKKTSAKTIGKCPKCMGDVIEGKRGYGCANWRPENGGCRFVIWKEYRGITVFPETATRLLSAREAGPVKSVFPETGKPCAATLMLVFRDPEWEVETVLTEPEEGTEIAESSLGNCPACGGEVVEGKKGYGCSRWRDKDGGCKFVIWKVIAGKEIPREAARKLLTEGSTGVIEGFRSRKGSLFSARLKFSPEDPGPPKVVFDFPPRTPER